MRFFASISAGLVLGAAALLPGCQSDNTPPQSTLVAATQGVTCTKCQTTWVKVPYTSGARYKVTSYTWAKRDACPDCKNAVDNFFATGKLEHACKTCGESMEVCRTH